MTDQRPVELVAIVGRDGAAVPYGRAGDNAAPPASHTLIPTLARVATAGFPERRGWRPHRGGLSSRAVVVVFGPLQRPEAGLQRRS